MIPNEGEILGYSKGDCLKYDKKRKVIKEKCLELYSASSEINNIYSWALRFIHQKAALRQMCIN